MKYCIKPLPESWKSAHEFRALSQGNQVIQQHPFLWLPHEVLEEVWRAAPDGEKKFLQGLIQVAVALHHHSKGNIAGARSLLARAVRNLSGYPEEFGGIHLAPLRQSLADWQRALADGADVPPVPKIQLAVGGRQSAGET